MNDINRFMTGSLFFGLRKITHLCHICKKFLGSFLGTLNAVFYWNVKRNIRSPLPQKSHKDGNIFIFIVRRCMRNI